MHVSFVSAIIFAVFFKSIAAYQCGRLVKEYVYDETNIARLDEFPWFGQIYFTNTLDGPELKYRCNGVLITKQHLLAPAHCFMRDIRYRAKLVVLGDSNYDNPMYEQDCDSNGKCAPVPKQYEIMDIAIHPNFDNRLRINDIAIVHLKEEAELSDYIQPICFSPPAIHTADLVTQYFIFSGFVSKVGTVERTEKLKTVAHILPLKDCEQILRAPVPSTNICASSLGLAQFLSGSALMGINVENTTLSNYYLLGILSYGTNPSTKMLDVFNRVTSYANWIHTNINKL